MDDIAKRLKAAGYPKVLEGPIDIRHHKVTINYVDLLQQRIAELEAQNKRLKTFVEALEEDIRCYQADL